MKNFHYMYVLGYAISECVGGRYPHPLMKCFATASKLNQIIQIHKSVIENQCVPIQQCLATLGSPTTSDK